MVIRCNGTRISIDSIERRHGSFGLTQQNCKQRRSTRIFHFQVKTDFYEFLEINTSKKLRDLAQLLVALGIMSNHIHLVFRSTEGIPPGQLLGSFKRHTSMAVVKAIKENDRESRKENLLETFKRNGSKKSNVTYNQFWRQENKPIELWSNFVISQKIRYIHNNPVEQGLVFRPEDYPYSSAVDYSGEKGVLNGVVVVGL